MIRPILLHPDPRLKKVCAPVARVDDEIRTLIDDMLATMYHAPGIGLAAPQVGVGSRVIVMDCADREAGEEPDPVCLVNPRTVWASEESRTHNEGCLSLPDIYADVTRPAEVRVQYLDRGGEEHERHFSGLGATCVQHEIDHLNGRLFIDYLNPMRRQMITNKMRKLKRERAKAD